MNMKTRPLWKHQILPFLLSAAVALMPYTLSQAAPGDVNSTNDGQNVAGGTYYNTAGSETLFTNTSGTGLHVGAGVDVRGLETSSLANPASNLTGNGGVLNFYAPGGVVKVDGTIDASAFFDGGAYQGNGGTIKVTSAYLYQNGNLYANGQNGGLIQLNVGSMTATSGSHIEAMGFGGSGSDGSGGAIKIKAHDVASFENGAVVDASGHVIGLDSTLIQIVGGVVNVNGILRANGLLFDDDTGSQGGRIELVALGGATADPMQAVIDSDLFDTPQPLKQHILDDHAELLAFDGDVILGSLAKLQANGTDARSSWNDGILGNRAGDGGCIVLAAQNDIIFDGSPFMEANGGRDAKGHEPATLPVDEGYKGKVVLYTVTGEVKTDGHHEVADLIETEGQKGPECPDCGDPGRFFDDGADDQGADDSGTDDGTDDGSDDQGADDGTDDGADDQGADDSGTDDGTDDGSDDQGADDGTDDGADDQGTDDSGTDDGTDDGADDQGADDSGTDDGTDDGSDDQGADDGSDDRGGDDIGIDDSTDGSDDGADDSTDDGRGTDDGADGGTDDSGTVPDDPDANLLGLFQEQRPGPVDPPQNPIPQLVLAFGQNNMFLARAYKPVTQEILNLAIEAFNRELAQGKQKGDAQKQTAFYLAQTGVDAEVAKILLEQLQTGQLLGDDNILAVLKAIAETTPAPVEELVQ